MHLSALCPIFLSLPTLILANPIHEHEHRDVAGLYYGPDTTNTAYLPVPSSAIGPPIDPKLGYRIQDLGFGTYMVTEGAYQSLFLISTTSVILIDAPTSIGHKLSAAIKSITDKPVSHFIYSHSHSDHVGAAYLFNSTVKEYIAHTETRQNLQRLKPLDPARPLPNNVFAEEKIVKVDNQTLKLVYKGNNHEAGNIFIYAPAPKALMVVDIVFPGWVPFSELAESQDIPGWTLAHAQILEYDFTYYIGGHLNRLGTRADVLLQQEYVSDLQAQCALADNVVGFNLTGGLSPVEEANKGNSWAEFKTAFKLIADRCAETTAERWVGRLAGVDVFGWENAYKMASSLRIDRGVLGPFGVGAS